MDKMSQVFKKYKLPCIKEVSHGDVMQNIMPAVIISQCIQMSYYYVFAHLRLILYVNYTSINLEKNSENFQEVFLKYN